MKYWTTDETSEITLLDYFAIRIASGCCSDVARDYEHDWAKRCYRLADALMREKIARHEDEIQKTTGSELPF